MSAQPPDDSHAPEFDIAHWLESLSLGEYAGVFAENHISFETLVHLTNQDLVDLGVASLGHRKTLLLEIQKLAAGNQPAAAPAPPPLPKPAATGATPVARKPVPAQSPTTSRLTPVAAPAATPAPAAPSSSPEARAKKVRFWAKLAASKIFVVSLVLHLLFGMGATYYVVQTIQAKRKVSFQEGPPNPSRSKRALEHKVSMAQKKKSGGAPPQAKRIVSTGIAKVSLPEMPAMPSTTNVVPGMMSGMGGAGFGQGMGFGSGMGSGVGGAGGGGGMNFFGFKGAVQSVVFVIDISGSMISGTKDADSYDRLEQEVIKAINGLAPNAKMDLIAFSAEAHLFSQTMVTAGIPEKQRAITWLKSYSPCKALPRGVKTGSHDLWLSPAGKRHMGTRSDIALEEAFKLNPGIIFFVSDGEPSGTGKLKSTDMQKEILKQVTGYQTQAPKKVVINAIAYEADSGQAFMRKLAESNGGEFKNIQN